MRPAGTVNSSAVLVLPNVKVRMEAKHPVPALSFHKLLGKALVFKIIKSKWKAKEGTGER